MNSFFKDHFSEQSHHYQQFRPHYPASLYQYLSTLTSKHERAWDCGTGTGQAAIQLANYYSEVIATDASAEQIKNTPKKNGVQFRVAQAEASGLESNSIDLITVAQAVHWFELAQFTQEVDRVLVNGGVLAIWTYNLLRIRPDIDELINHLYRTTLERYWPAERRLIENDYRDINFPFQQIDPPLFHMQYEWDLPQLAGYLCTWSAVKRFEKAHAVNPVEQLTPQLADRWGDTKTRLNTAWPLTVKLWQK